MQNLDRESILRIFGLHDVSSIARQINAIQLSLEEQEGQMVTFWTEIRKDEKQISLIAGRMDTAETNIGQLQVTAQSLTASVTSLNTTVSGHTTQIGQLEITANSLTASVSSLNTTVSGHTTSIGQLQVTASSISNRVTVIEGDYVKNAQISLMVVKDGNGYISNALIDADDIDFVFTQAVSWYWQSKTEANKRMGLDSSGNLWISGEYRGGTIVDTVQVGSGTKKMFIEPTSSGARLVGKDGSTEVLSLGFYEYSGVYKPSLRLGHSFFNETYGQIYGSFGSYLSTIDYGLDSNYSIINFYSNYGSSSTYFYIGIRDGSAFIRSTNYEHTGYKWPTDRNSVSIGQVFLGSDEILRVKMA